MDQRLNSGGVILVRPTLSVYQLCAIAKSYHVMSGGDLNIFKVSRWVSGNFWSTTKGSGLPGSTVLGLHLYIFGLANLEDTCGVLYGVAYILYCGKLVHAARNRTWLIPRSCS